MRWLLILCLISSSAWGGEKKNFDHADEAIDQSLVLAIGRTDNEQTAFRVQYLHPLWNRVMWTIGAAHSEKDGDGRTDALTGLRIFPFGVPLFGQMGLGITRASTDGFRIRLGLGYTVDLVPSVYVEFNVGRDFITEVDETAEDEDRWTLTIGFGKRF